MGGSRYVLAKAMLLAVAAVALVSWADGVEAGHPIGSTGAGAYGISNGGISFQGFPCSSDSTLADGDNQFLLGGMTAIHGVQNLQSGYLANGSTHHHHLGQIGVVNNVLITDDPRAVEGFADGTDDAVGLPVSRGHFLSTFDTPVTNGTGDDLGVWVFRQGADAADGYCVYGAPSNYNGTYYLIGADYFEPGDGNGGRIGFDLEDHYVNLSGSQQVRHIAVLKWGTQNPLWADFSYTPALPYALNPVQFQAEVFQMYESIDGYAWDFGDGKFGSGTNPTHIYNKAGTYNVCLRVWDRGEYMPPPPIGSNPDPYYVDRVCKPITVLNNLPVPDFSYKVLPDIPFRWVEFEDLSTDIDGTIVAWNWDFTFATSTSQDPVVEFPDFNRPFLVTLNVTDDDGGQAEVSKWVDVPNTPPVLRRPIPDFVTNEGGSISFRNQGSDADFHPIQFDVRQLPEGAFFDTQTGYFEWKPQKGQAGEYQVAFRVEEVYWLPHYDEEWITILVEPREQPPTSIDQDGDGAPDAHDPCAAGSGNDRDGDGIDDACDPDPTDGPANQPPPEPTPEPAPAPSEPATLGRIDPVGSHCPWEVGDADRDGIPDCELDDTPCDTCAAQGVVSPPSLTECACESRGQAAALVAVSSFGLAVLLGLGLLLLFWWRRGDRKRDEGL